MPNPHRFVLFPIKYHQVWEMYKKHEVSPPCPAKQSIGAHWEPIPADFLPVPALRVPAMRPTHALHRAPTAAARLAVHLFGVAAWLPTVFATFADGRRRGTNRGSHQNPRRAQPIFWAMAAGRPR